MQCDDYKCIPLSNICDDIPDCNDGKDEQHCGMYVNLTDFIQVDELAYNYISWYPDISQPHVLQTVYFAVTKMCNY